MRRVRCATVMDGAINRDVFDAFVQHVLAPELRPGDVVILDNLSSHNSERAPRMIESRGARLEFLAPYSPDLNPIEMVFSKFKQLRRSLACRTHDAQMPSHALGPRPPHTLRRQLLPTLRIHATSRVKPL